MASDQDLYHELSFYTLAHSDPSFLHQHMVDAYTAQHADETTRPIAIVFALVGLYLHIEKDFTGRQVQRFHIKLAKIRRQWVRPLLPKERGDITVRHVLAAAAGPSRDALIHSWCASVWEAWNDSHDDIANLAKNELGILNAVLLEGWPEFGSNGVFGRRGVSTKFPENGFIGMYGPPVRESISLSTKFSSRARPSVGSEKTLHRPLSAMPRTRPPSYGFPHYAREEYALKRTKTQPSH